MTSITQTQKKKPLWRMARIIPAIALCAATLLTATPRAEAGSATLSWSAPTTNSDGTPVTSLSGYKVYTRTATGSYSTGTDVGNVTSYAANNLTDGSTYYFAVTAYNTSKTESAKSNEVSKALPATTTTYSITATAGAGGSISATNNSSVNTATNGTSTVTTATVATGATQAFSITPATGYSISGVSVDGASVGAVSSYSFSNVTANHTIAATFAATTTGTGTGGTGGTTTSTTAFAVNAGGAAYTTGSGVAYAADARYSGGSVAAVTSTISNTTEGYLYQSERYGNFTYSVPLTNGNYNVVLKFAETYWTAAGKRVFNVAVNGATAISNLDVYAKAGGANRAYDVTVPATVTNGTLTLGFTSVTDNAKVCAIRVVPSTSGSGAILFANNAGGSSYTSSTNVTYLADCKYTGGSVASVTSAIAGTTDQALYQTERYGNFSYNVPVANGNYTVTLKFAETYWTAAGKRVFNVAVNGATAISNLDVYAKAGGSNKAYDVDIPVTVTNGTLNINFSTVVDNAKVDAIIIRSA